MFDKTKSSKYFANFFLCLADLIIFSQTENTNYLELCEITSVLCIILTGKFYSLFETVKEGLI